MELHTRNWGWEQSGKSGNSLKVEGRASSYLPPSSRLRVLLHVARDSSPRPALRAACPLPRCFRFRSSGL